MILLCSCSIDFIDNTSQLTEEEKSLLNIDLYFTKDESKVANFSKNMLGDFHFSNGYKNNNPFNCYWSRSSGKVENGLLSLSITKDNEKFLAGEYKSNNVYSYGYYSTSMKAIKNQGVISSFFTYTGYPWDEIDIEFLGEKTTGIQLNYYHNGIGKHEYYYNLGFDGSIDFHEYGFYWDNTQIVWFVDGRPIHYANVEIPENSMHIIANVWNGKGKAFDEWCGSFDENTNLPLTAQYEWFGYSNQKLKLKSEEK